jgi:hypothetical protein
MRKEEDAWGSTAINLKKKLLNNIIFILLFRLIPGKKSLYLKPEILEKKANAQYSRNDNLYQVTAAARVDV